jgi:hypothetical protein
MTGAPRDCLKFWIIVMVLRWKLVHFDINKWGKGKLETCWVDVHMYKNNYFSVSFTLFSHLKCHGHQNAHLSMTMHRVANHYSDVLVDICQQGLEGSKRGGRRKPQVLSLAPSMGHFMWLQYYTMFCHIGLRTTITEISSYMVYQSHWKMCEWQ